VTSDHHCTRETLPLVSFASIGVWTAAHLLGELAVRAGLAVASCAMIFGPDKRFLSKRVV